MRMITNAAAVAAVPHDTFESKSCSYVEELAKLLQGHTWDSVSNHVQLQNAVTNRERNSSRALNALRK